MQKRGPPRMSVPQFGGWDKKYGAPEGTSGYTMVFTKARADRQHQKNDLSDVKRQTQLDQLHHHRHQDTTKHNKAHRHHHLPHHHNKHDHRHGKPEEEQASASAASPNQMRKKRNNIMAWFCCWFRL